MQGLSPPPRLTKIVCTIGPACGTPQQMAALAKAGMNVARVNLSHGTAREQEETIRQLLRIREEAPLGMSVMLDTRGAEIRTGDVQDPIPVTRGEEVLFVSDGDRHVFPSSQKIIRVNYDGFAQDVRETDRILIDNGELSFDIIAISPEGTVRARAREDGRIGNRRHVNLPGADINLPSITERDWADIAVAVEYGVDFLALSFIRTGEEVTAVRRYLDERKSDIQIITKVETQQAVRNVDDLIRASDAIMVARGDLAVEIGDAVVPALQKRMIKMARARNRLAITATQMMESMVSNPVPTRAEVSDVANAVLDGTDAVMLSAETAVGQYPVETVETMSRVCIEAEKQMEIHLDRDFMDQVFTRIDQSIAMAALFTAYHLKAKAIGALTQSGSTALWMSRMNSGVPIYGLTPVVETRRKMALFSGVHPIRFNPPSQDREETLRAAEDELLRRGAVREGDLIVLTIGEAVGLAGHTNTLKVVRVGEYRITQGLAQAAVKPRRKKA